MPPKFIHFVFVIQDNFFLLIHRSEENEEYNDIPLIYEQEHYDTLIKGGIDRQLAQHVAHLFIRDPVSLFSEKIHQDNTKDSDHFEVCSVNKSHYEMSCLSAMKKLT